MCICLRISRARVLITTHVFQKRRHGHAHQFARFPHTPAAADMRKHACNMISRQSRHGLIRVCPFR
nr:MAG TPA: hypothetical protein [Caudoviricetes sp.]